MATRLSREELLAKVPPPRLQALYDQRLDPWEIAAELGVDRDVLEQAVELYARSGKLALAR